ncbi:unnamed protein product, partial [Strongylus vulgaris]
MEWFQDDWSWHRNPAAAIRSGGTNKQTPVWKYFVYNKAENLSSQHGNIRMKSTELNISKTYQSVSWLPNGTNNVINGLSGLVDYTRERYGGQLPSSPSSSASGSNSSSTSNNTPAPKPAKPKKEAKAEVSNFMAALRAGTPAIPGLLQNLMQSVNPLQ